jgi:riboflavin synthase alpha subunit
MFTGIIESTGAVLGIHQSGTNYTFTVQSPLASELKVDQSLAHNGVCLTVVSIDTASGTHQVTAISETLSKTNLGQLQVGSVLNLERCLVVGARLDGHFVQGHVDGTATVTSSSEVDYSGTASVDALAEVSCLAIAVWNAIAGIEGNADISADGHVIGDEWDNVVEQPNTWTIVPSGDNTWTVVSSQSDTWTRQ